MLKDSIKGNFFVKRIQDSFLYVASSFIALPVSLITSPLYAKHLSAKDFAEYGFFSNLQLFLISITSLSFYNYYMTVYDDKAPKDNEYALRSLFSFLLVFNLFFSLVSYFFIHLYFWSTGGDFNYVANGLIVSFAASTYIGVGFCSVQFKFLRQSLNFFLLRLFIVFFSNGLGLYLVIFLDSGSFGRLSPILICNVAVLLFFFKRFIRTVSIDMKLIRDSFFFCYPLVLTAILSFPIQYIDRFLLEGLHNNTEFAYYNIAGLIAGYFSVFTAAILQAFEPDIFKFSKNKDKKELIGLFAIYIVIVLFGAIMFILFSDYIVSYLTAGKYLGASKYLMNFLAAKILEQSIIFFGFIIIALRLTKLSLINKVILAVFSLLLNFYFIKMYEFHGALWAKIIILSLWMTILGVELFFRNTRYLKRFQSPRF